METTASHTLGLGEESSIWFKLTPLLRGDPENPMRILHADDGPLWAGHCRSTWRISVSC